MKKARDQKVLIAATILVSLIGIILALIKFNCSRLRFEKLPADNSDWEAKQMQKATQDQ